MELVAAYLHDRALRRERHYRDPLDPLHVNDNHLLRYYRFPRHEILWLCEVLDPYLRRRTRRSHAVPTHTQVLVALRFYASGTFQSVIGDSCGLTQASISRIIAAVTRVLTEKARIEIKFPSSANDLRKTVQDFSRIANFPRVIGAIDGTHIPIKAPYVDEHIYVNRKRFHSLNLQVVCNADGLITSYNTRYPGSTHDAFIWSNCALRTRFETGEFGENYLLGDSGYPLEPYLLTPLLNPRTPGETRYNRSHTRTRVIIEQTFGILKSRFRCLHHSGGTLQYDPVKCSKIAIACLLLHNYCVKRRIPVPQEIVENDGEMNIAAEAAERGTGQAVRARLIENWYS
ncbi:putative nuclease HARBI1 [Penaeus chinensis]|uniref:putative nuclease HARBI1 n=1 Tax=Penaeus chinensis TaxID=139456 RepID=UPI001FB5B115|nr:putative nuclease HARBI1 [Penaeus chinensis]XP_047471635.1 putative nuclease HARBI1 [Penaeus chinensis]